MSPEEAWEYVRRAVISSTRTWADGRYNIDDPAFVDGCIEAAVKKIPFRGTMPTDERRLTRLIRSATTTYSSRLLTTDEGRALSQRRVEAVWLSPPMHVDEAGRAVAELGWPPGEFKRTTRAGMGIPESPYVEKGELTPAALADQLQRLRQQHPDAKAYELRVSLPHGRTSRRNWEYRWEVAGRRIIAWCEGYRDGMWLTRAPVADLDAVRSGAVSTRTADMERVRKLDRIWAGRADIPDR